jgi:hypothetical protein
MQGVSLSTASSIHMQGVFLSTASIMHERAGCIPFNCQKYKHAGLQGVFLSTASSMGMQGVVYLSTSLAACGCPGCMSPY